MNLEVKKKTKNRHLLRFKGVGWCVVEAGVGKDGQCAHGGENDKDPQEHAVHHHGNVLPVLLQLPGGRDKRVVGRKSDTENGESVTNGHKKEPSAFTAS